MTSELKVGLVIEQPKLGLGKIILLDGDSAWIYFKDVVGDPKDAIKRLKIAQAGLAVAAQQSDPVLDNLPPMVKNGVVTPPNHVRITESQAVNLFVENFRSFEDRRYLDQERNYKWDAHIQAVDKLQSKRGRAQLADESNPELPKTIRGLLSATNLLATQELMRLNDAFKVAGAAARFGQSSLQFAESPSSSTFALLVSAVDALDDGKGSNMLSWPIVSLLPFLIDPLRHMFLKPMVTQRITDACFFDILYTARPKWETYVLLLRFSELLLTRLRPLGARDMIDVQSFMWIVAGAPYMKAREK